MPEMADFEVSTEGYKPHARTSPLFPIAWMAATRLTLATQDYGGYTGYFRGVVFSGAGTALRPFIE